MPYVITTTTPYADVPATTLRESHVTRRAVATLEEARHAAYCRADAAVPDGITGGRTTGMTSDEQRADRWARVAIRDLPESGGTVGPLPDGTVIEVAPVHWGSLATLAGDSQVIILTSDDETRVIDAYNAAQGAVRDRLEYLRSRIKAESISYGEIVELQGLAEHIHPDDVVLLEWAGVPESEGEEV